MRLLKVFLFLSVFHSALLAFEDYDLDGVEDVFDDCPNTLMTDLVDINGCTIHSLQKSYDFDIIFGVTQTDSEYDSAQKIQTTLTTLQLDYYHKAFSFQLSSAYLSSTQSSLADTYVSAYYNIAKEDDFNIRFGFGLALPSAEIEGENKTDIITNINLSYKLAFINAFTGYSFTLVNDKSETITYQNSSAYNLGLGLYPTNKLYMSLSYNTSKSIYNGEEDTQNISLYGFYVINERWFSTLNYDHGISNAYDSNALSLKVGYYF